MVPTPAQFMERGPVQVLAKPGSSGMADAGRIVTTIVSTSPAAEAVSVAVTVLETVAGGV